MRLALVCIGKLKAGPERSLFDRYLKRLTDSARSAGVAAVDVREIGESRARRADERRAEEGAAILAAVPRGGALVLLDERGAAMTSEEWAARHRPRAGRLEAGLCGRDRRTGRLDPSLAAAAHRTVSFGAMTWPHQLVRVMAGEQLYRAMTILAGHPYHRA